MAFETSENLPKYFKQIQHLQPLSLEREHELVDLIAAGDESAVHELVEHNLKIVVKIANRHIGQGLAIDDLIQEGNIGLYEAAYSFKKNGDARFITYAQLWIRKRINEAVAQKGRLVRIPHNLEYERFKMKRAGKEVENLRPVRMDDKVTDDSDAAVGDLILGCAPEIEKEHNITFNKAKIESMLAILKPRDRKIIKCYFGIGRDCEMQSGDIAELFEMTNVRVCQIVKSSIEKMKEHA
jgi:RNA polymerase primary sigma factor